MPIALARSVTSAGGNAVERSRAWLAASVVWLDQSEALAWQAMARAVEHQAETGRTPAATEQESKPPQLPEAKPQSCASSKVAELRRHFAQIALMLAETEDKVARHHEDLSAHWPDRAAECRHMANQARQEARRARKVASDFGD